MGSKALSLPRGALEEPAPSLSRQAPVPDPVPLALVVNVGTRFVTTDRGP